jgi:YbbR domain-containing protein
MKALQRFARTLPTLLLAFIIAVAVWALAVTSSDPSEKRVYPKSVTLEVIGQDPGLVITSDLPTSVSLTLTAPVSVWNELTTQKNAVRALVDLSSLGAGTHTIPVQIQIALRPVQVDAFTPATLSITLDELTTQPFPITLAETGEPAVGFQAGAATLSQETVNVSGASAAVRRVTLVRAALDIAGSQENINRPVKLEAVDAGGMVVTDVKISPDTITVNQPVTQLGGFRTVSVKVVTSGQLASGYRLTTLFTSPPSVTVFSSDPTLVAALPGFVETEPLDLSGAKDDFDMRLRLNLPPGVEVIGDPSVQVQVGIAAIESSVTLANMKVEIIGLAPNLLARFQPDTVDVIITGPLPLLEKLTAADLRVVIDLTGVTPGTYQKTPTVVWTMTELSVESLLPASIEVTVYLSTVPTP